MVSSLDTHWWDVGINPKYKPYKFDPQDFERILGLTQRLETVQDHCKNILPSVSHSAANIIRSWLFNGTLQDLIFSNMTLAFAKQTSKQTTASPNDIKHIRRLSMAVLTAISDYTIFDALGSGTAFFREAVCSQGIENRQRKTVQQTEWYKICQTHIKNVRKELHENHPDIPITEKDEKGHVYPLPNSIYEYLQTNETGSTTGEDNDNIPSPFFLRLQALHGAHVLSEDLQLFIAKTIITDETNNSSNDNTSTKAPGNQPEDTKRYLYRVITGLCLLLPADFIISRVHSCLPPTDNEGTVAQGSKKKNTGTSFPNIRKHIPEGFSEEDATVIETEVIRIQSEAWQQGTYLWIVHLQEAARSLTDAYGWKAITSTLLKQIFTVADRILPPINPLWSSAFNRYQELFNYKLSRYPEGENIEFKDSVKLSRKVFYQLAQEFNVPWDTNSNTTMDDHPELDTDYDEETERQKKIKRKAKQLITDAERQASTASTMPVKGKYTKETMDSYSSDDSGWGEEYFVNVKVEPKAGTISVRKVSAPSKQEYIPSPVPVIPETDKRSDTKATATKRSKTEVPPETQPVDNESMGKTNLLPRVTANAVPPPVPKSPIRSSTSTAVTANHSNQGSHSSLQNQTSLSSLQSTDPVMFNMFNRLKRAREERVKQQMYEQQLIAQISVSSTAPSSSNTGNNIPQLPIVHPLQSSVTTHKSPGKVVIAVDQTIPEEMNEHENEADTDDLQRTNQVLNNLSSAADRIRQLANDEAPVVASTRSSSNVRQLTTISSSATTTDRSSTTDLGTHAAAYPRLNNLNISGSVAYGMQNVQHPYASSSSSSSSSFEPHNAIRRGPFNPAATGRRITEEETFNSGTPSGSNIRTDHTDMATHNVPSLPSFQRTLVPNFEQREARQRIRWSPEEENALIQGMAKFNNTPGHWAQIRKDFFTPLFDQGYPERTAVDLKDKWRNMTRNRTDDTLRGAYSGR